MLGFAVATICVFVFLAASSRLTQRCPRCGRWMGAFGGSACYRCRSRFAERVADLVAAQVEDTEDDGQGELGASSPAQEKAAGTCLWTNVPGAKWWRWSRAERRESSLAYGRSLRGSRRVGARVLDDVGGAQAEEGFGEFGFGNGLVDLLALPREA